MSEPDPFGLSARDLMPDWVSDLESGGASLPKTDSFQDRNESESRKPRNRRDRQGGGRGPGGGGGDRNRPPRGRDQGNRDFRGRGGGRRDDDRGRGSQQRHGGRGGGHQSYGPPEDPIPALAVLVRPTDETVDLLAKHIRSTGRAYALMEVARMVLAARERYQLVFKPAKKKEKDSKENVPPAEHTDLFLCKADQSLWTSQEEATAHLLKGNGLEDYYLVEEVSVNPPKGNFSVVAVCGMSGQILGPPNHHEYQQTIAKLHRERFSHLSLERYKSRIEMRRDEETIEEWKKQASTARHYTVKPRETAKPAPEEAAASVPPAEEPEAATAESTPAPPVEPEVEAPAEAESVEAAAPDESAGDSAAAPEESDTPVAETAAAETPDTPEDADTTETSATEEETPEADANANAEPKGEEAEDPSPAVVLKSDEELLRHFRENFASKAIKKVRHATVPGDIPGRRLAQPLLTKLKTAVDSQRRGFPLPLIQELCRAFERRGLKFFKRGKKTLYVALTRPRSISDESALTDRVRKIVDYIRDHPNTSVTQMLIDLVPGYDPPKKKDGTPEKDHVPSQGELSVLADLRWLITEGYVIEYPSGEVELGRGEHSQSQNQGGREGGGPAKQKAAKGEHSPKSSSKKPRPKAPKPEAAAEKPVSARETAPAASNDATGAAQEEGATLAEPETAPPGAEKAEPETEPATSSQAQEVPVKESAPETPADAGDSSEDISSEAEAPAPEPTAEPEAEASVSAEKPLAAETPEPSPESPVEEERPKAKTPAPAETPAATDEAEPSPTSEEEEGDTPSGEKIPASEAG